MEDFLQLVSQHAAEANHARGLEHDFYRRSFLLDQADEVAFAFDEFALGDVDGVVVVCEEVFDVVYLMVSSLVARSHRCVRVDEIV